MFEGLTLNWWAVVVGGLICMATGMVWYNPKVFGKMWMKANGLSEDDMKGSDKMGQLYFLQFVAALVMVWVTALFVMFVNPATTADGFMLGFWLWLGFLVAGSAGLYTWPPKPLNLFVMDSIYKLINIFLVIWLVMTWK